LDPAYAKLEAEKVEILSKMSEKDKSYFKAYRLALIERGNDVEGDPENWWNKLQQMSKEELEKMPLSFVKKYSSFLIKLKDGQELTKLEDNRSLPYYQQIKDLKRLETNEEKLAKAVVLDIKKAADTSFQYEREGYMSRQPRIDLKQYNYNFEQFREYTTLYERAKKKDSDDLTAFYKMVKYVNDNVASGDQRAVALSQKFRFDLI
jgi:hypothetical protein